MTTTTETVTSKPSDYGLPAYQTRLRKGDVTTDGYIVMMVNDSRALIGNLTNRSDTASIATTVSRSYVAERRGESGLHDFLARKTPRAEAAAGETTNETGDNNMAGKSKTKKASKSKKAPRGGLAADALAAQANGETKPKGRKAKTPKEPKESTRVQIMGNSPCPVLRALGHDGVTKEHAMAIMKANGIEVSVATVSVHVYQGKMSTPGKKIADLTKAQLAELRASAPEPTEPEPAAKE